MNVISELEDLLRVEQELLLSGDFAALETLVDRKSRLADRLAKHHPKLPAIAVRHLTELAKNNEALLSSAARGLKAAMTQVSQTSDQDSQTTYSKTGERLQLSRSSSTVTQKI